MTDRRSENTMRKWLRTMIIAAPAILLAIQAVPYGRDHDNPPVIREPPWPNAQTRALAKRACFDCHSNETVWPAYSNIAPLSWLVRSDVTVGRKELNFSEWRGGVRKGERPGKIRGAVDEGEMPPFYYTAAHPEARLSPRERTRLSEGLAAAASRLTN